MHPGDTDLLNVAETALTSYDLLGFKFQLLLTDFFITDPRLTPVYDLVRREDKILVFHAGTGPAANHYVGVPGSFGNLFNNTLIFGSELPIWGVMSIRSFLSYCPVSQFYFDTAMILGKS